MKTKLIKLALSFFSSDDGRKFVRNVAVVIISPFVAITVLIGAIFSDGISFNHNLVTDLFEGNPISELTGEMKQYVQEIQDGLVLIDSHIDKINQTFTNGSSLNIYQVKGYFIGYMVSSQHKVFSDEMAEAWVNSFTEGEEVKVPTSVNAVIYASLEKNLNEKLINVPRDVDLEVANRKLRFLGKSIDTLTPEQQEVVDECGKLAVQYEREINRAGDDEILSRWQSKNGVEVTPYEDLDIDSFKAVVEPVTEWYIGELKKQGYKDAEELVAAFK